MRPGECGPSRGRDRVGVSESGRRWLCPALTTGGYNSPDGLSPEPHHAGTLLSDFPSPELSVKTSVVYKPLRAEVVCHTAGTHATGSPVANWVKPPLLLASLVTHRLPATTPQAQPGREKHSHARLLACSSPRVSRFPATVCEAGSSGLTLSLQEFFLPHLLAGVAFDPAPSLGSQWGTQ